MKNKSRNETSKQNARHLLGRIALMCAIAALPPSFAAEKNRGEAMLNFAGADIESVIKAVGHYTNMTFIIDPRVKGTINLVSEKPVTKAQAFSLLSSALRLQGFTIVIGDGFAKVVPESDAKLQSGPIQTGAVRGDQIATQIFRLNYESAPNLVTVLRPLISPNNTINANPGNNSLVITDYADNLKRLGKIIAALDAPSTGDLDIVPIRYAIASDIAVMVNRLMESGGQPGGGGAERVSVLADSRTNSVVIRAPSAARANLAKSLIDRLDQPTSQPGNVHVVYLRNADATKLAQTLRAVVSLDTSSPSPSSSPSSSNAMSQMQPQGNSGGLSAPPSAPSSSSQPALPAGGTAGYIQADVSTNTLIITASEPVYRNLRAVIDQLDARRAQVYIESLIVEMTADKAAEFGIQWLGATGSANSTYRLGGGTGFSNSNAAPGTTNNLFQLSQFNKLGQPPGDGLSLGIFRQLGGKLTLGAVAHALASDGNTNILSTPNLITLDNEEAKIIVGQNVPFITGQYTTAASAGGSAGVNPFQTVERKDIGLSLRVKPQISEGGTVKMAIYQETSSVDTTQSNTAGLITNKRSIDTNVLVDDGQIIVLGGLIRDEMDGGEEKVPGLGDIPVIGNLFKYQNRRHTKTNLMVFLRPTIVRTNEQSVNLMADRYDYIRNQEINAQPEQKLVLPNMTSPVLPALENGKPTGDLMLRAKPGTQGQVQPLPPVPLQTPETTPKQ
jgi:general secretion pathway protein D